MNKRVNFLKEVISKLQLTDITAMHGRAEDFAQNKEYRESFDLCVSRAVANLATLSEYCLPFVKKNGRFISYKSEKVSEEFSYTGKVSKKSRTAFKGTNFLNMTLMSYYMFCGKYKKNFSFLIVEISI